MPQCRHVGRITQRLRTEELPGRTRRGVDRITPIERDNRDTVASDRRHPIGDRSHRQIRRGRTVRARTLPASRIDQSRKALGTLWRVGGPLLGRDVDQLAPRVDVGLGEVEHCGTACEAFEVQFDAPRASPAHEQRLEDAVATYRGEVVGVQERFVRLVALTVEGHQDRVRHSPRG
ncbi:Uncharacterised protein [Mycobacteroides abscessus subsp. abscessus]|nr:Uncharacterised protein [Mycobacteroides abscessus subsp. abscessus]